MYFIMITAKNQLKYNEKGHPSWMPISLEKERFRRV